MPPHPPKQIVSQVARAKTQEIKQWRTGATFVSESGHSVDLLCCKAAEARWKFSEVLRKEGIRCMSLNPPAYRIAVNRFYYSMYHSLRSVVYLSIKGDDYQEHRLLPTNVPDEFPRSDIWKNRLKDARETRNRADYEPFPRTDPIWKNTAEELQDYAQELSSITKSYLRDKGCNSI